MGGAEFGTRVCGCEELLGNGPKGGAVNGEAERHWGSTCRVEGSGGDEAWRVSRVDW